jgi:phasin family protein
MANEMVVTSLNQAQKFMAPMVKFNKLTVANLEKMFHLQHSNFMSYADIGLSQMKIAAEVTSLEDMPALFKSQMEATTALRHKMLEDVKEFADMAMAFKADFQHLTEEAQHLPQETPPEPKPKTPAKTAA